MNKQKVIETAYGENWEKVKEFVDENGWIYFDKLSPWDTGVISWEFKEGNANLWRPVTLSNLEYNNGWTEIKSIEDIPTEEYVYWVMRKDVKVPLYRKVEVFTIKEKHYWLKTFSHYQRISKPSPPIY